MPTYAPTDGFLRQGADVLEALGRPDGLLYLAGPDTGGPPPFVSASGTLALVVTLTGTETVLVPPAPGLSGGGVSGRWWTPPSQDPIEGTLPDVWERGTLRVIATLSGAETIATSGVALGWLRLRDAFTLTDSGIVAARMNFTDRAAVSDDGTIRAPVVLRATSTATISRSRSLEEEDFALLLLLT